MIFTLQVLVFKKKLFELICLMGLFLSVVQITFYGYAHPLLFWNLISQFQNGIILISFFQVLRKTYFLRKYKPYTFSSFIKKMWISFKYWFSLVRSG